MMKPASPWKIVALLVILFVPSIYYLLISRGKNNFRKLEIYGPKEIPSGTNSTKVIWDTIFHQIPAFSFTDQYGRPFSNKSLAGCSYVANFFFTSCKTICPGISKELQRIQETYKTDTLLKIVSFSVDPINDSVPVLASYAKNYKAIKDKWYFITGNQDSIYALARNGFFLAAFQQSDAKNGIDHSEQLVLIDRKKQIRGYYDGTDKFEIKRLMDEIIVLEWEYKNP